MVLGAGYSGGSTGTFPVVGRMGACSAADLCTPDRPSRHIREAVRPRKLVARRISGAGEVSGSSGSDEIPVSPASGSSRTHMSRRYLLISPCRDEQDHMRQTVDSVLAQSIRPATWVIVDDGSTDGTPDILAEYAQRHDWIKIITRGDRGQRAVGPGVIEAFYARYEAVRPHHYDYLCKLDLDLSLPPRYFEILMQRMEANPRIATCSGKAYIEQDGRPANERHGDDTSLGMTKFYRVSCFKAIGGFVREVMWDGIDCHLCRMKGWVACSWDEPELRFVHLRPMGSSQKSIYTGRMRHGFGQYFMGTGLAYMTASAL